MWRISTSKPCQGGPKKKTVRGGVANGAGPFEDYYDSVYNPTYPFFSAIDRGYYWLGAPQIYFMFIPQIAEDEPILIGIFFERVGSTTS